MTFAGGRGRQSHLELRRGPLDRHRFSVTVSIDPKIAVAIAAVG